MRLSTAPPRGAPSDAARVTIRDGASFVKEKELAASSRTPDPLAPLAGAQTVALVRLMHGKEIPMSSAPAQPPIVPKRDQRR